MYVTLVGSGVLGGSEEYLLLVFLLGSTISLPIIYKSYLLRLSVQILREVYSLVHLEYQRIESRRQSR